MTIRRTIAFLFLGAFLLNGCTSSSGTSTATTTTTTTTTAATNTGLDQTKLPLGDGKVSTSAQVGYVFSCQTTFNGTGASTVGPWVNSSAGTYDFISKSVVAGSVVWPTHSYTIALVGAARTISTNDLPNHNTGTYPIATTDPAHTYDGNPNHIAAQTIVYALPSNPTNATTPMCVGLGPIGFLLSGSVLYNALDALGRDAVAHEVQDLCQGHPDTSSSYHYHSLTTCLSDPGTGHSNLLGYAVDGFGIYGVRGESGQVLTNADLDACHGHTHSITWDGATVSMYHYHATYAYPYTIGCFHGTAVKASTIVGQLEPPFPHRHTP